MFINESLIPYGMYCYTSEGFYESVNGDYRLKTKLCPYYVFNSNGNSMCTLMKVDSEEDFLLDDQCKICGINEEDVDYIEE